MARNILLFVFLALNLGVNAQLSKKHFFPPMAAANFDNIGSANPDMPLIYISTPVEEWVNVTIYLPNGLFENYQVKNGSPVVVDFQSGGFNSPVFVAANAGNAGSFGQPISNKGIRIEAEDLIYANLRVNSTNGAQAEMLISKGNAAIGRTFYTAHLDNGYSFPDRLNFVSVMSLANNNAVTISGLDDEVNLLGLGTGQTEHTVVLQQYESLIFAATPYNSANPDADAKAFIGSLLSSTEDIVVNLGSANGNMVNTSNGRDYGMDQIAPLNLVGEEYVVVRGNGTNPNEKVIIVATEPNTSVFFNNYNQPIFLGQPGNYYITDINSNPNWYYDSQGVMALSANKPIYVYQAIMADAGCCTQGFCFIPPLSCAASNEINEIPDIHKIGSKSFIGSINVITQVSAEISIDGDQGSFGLSASGPIGTVPAGISLVGPLFATPSGGAPYMCWRIFGLQDNVRVFSDNDLYAGVFGYSNVAGWGGYFSGLDRVPEITATIEPINCIPSILTASDGFDFYQWFRNDSVIPGANMISYEATISGSYYVLSAFNGCPPVYSATINLENPDYLEAGADQEDCPNAFFQLSGSSSEQGPNFFWSTSGDGSFSDVTNLEAIYYPGELDIANGSVELLLNGNNNSCFDEDGLTLFLTDTVMPNPICQDLTLSLDFFGEAIFQPEEVDAGSFDNCAISSLWVEPYEMFTCDDLGYQSVELWVEDLSGNIASCQALIHVKDEIQPIGICKDIDLYLDEYGDGNLAPDDIDYGSFDNCGLESMTIDESFNELDCTDVGSLEVDLLLTDYSGNTTTCETIVHVQDVTPPNVNCQDVQVYLDENGQGVFNPYLLDNQSTDACGIGALYTIPDLYVLDCTNVGIIPVQLIVYDVNDNAAVCFSQVQVIDTFETSLSIPIDTQISNTVFVSEIEPELDNNADSLLNDWFGIITLGDNCLPTVQTEYWYELDACSAGYLYRVWTIYDEWGEPSIQDTQFIEVIHESQWDIVFPEDEIVECGDSILVNPPDLELIDVDFELIEVDFIDEIGSSSDGCYEIHRIWTALNWCTYPDEPMLLDTQILTVLDEIAPIIEVDSEVIIITGLGCSVNYSVPTPELLDCSPDVSWTYETDLPTGFVGPGVYSITYFAEDACGNTSSESITVTIQDSAPPNPVILDNINLELPYSGSITVQASFFDLGSYDNCTNYWIAFSDDGLEQSMTFDCSNLGQGTYSLWLGDEGGNTVQVPIEVTLLDPNDYCLNTVFELAGQAFKPNGEGIDAVEVHINDPFAVELTNAAGFYNGFYPSYVPYTLYGFRPDYAANGVTSYDIVLVVQHILGINPLNTPYALLAADVNNSNSVTTMDIVEMQQLILQISDGFSSELQWRFIDATYVFPNPNQPWSPVELIEIPNLFTDELDLDFIGVKLGDIDMSAQ